jgi:hypothetical protein
MGTGGESRLDSGDERGRPPTRRVGRWAAPLVLAASLLFAPQAAASVLAETVTAPQAVDRSCYWGVVGGDGVAAHTLKAPSFGMIEARLEGGSGDWDLAVFDAATGRAVAGSAYGGPDELAEGFVGAGQSLTVQACRRTGDDPTASLTAGFSPIDTSELETLSLVRVSTPSLERKNELNELGLDLTEYGGEDFIDVVLHGADDAQTLALAGFPYTVRVPDLGEQALRRQAADSAYAESIETSALPSGRTTYRRLFEYSDELKALADGNPDLVRYFTLPFETWEGRPVEGIEISEGIDASGGKPVLLNMGVHHAREWPASEHSMEWAYELVNGYRAGDPRVRSLMADTRTIVIPVVNPDGFNLSREAGAITNGRDGNETANIVASPPGEYQRKNCRLITDAEDGNCLQPGMGLLQAGVDPNRNYAGFWGGPGSSGLQLDQTYRGPAPFSEPETQNLQDLVSQNQVTTLITNHTYSNLVLRPPGVAGAAAPPDNAIYKALGDAMAAENGYVSQPGYQLYDTTGTTEDWSYYATGGLGFTFEIGPTNFHPPFEQMVAEYEGTTPAAGEGDGNREAYFLAQENAADPSKHSVLTGSAPAGANLRITKSFETPTSTEGVTVQDTLTSSLEVPASGRYEWHINPSTRPLVMESGRDPTAPPSPPESFSGGPDPIEAMPCGDADTNDPACFNDHPFVVPNDPGTDNGSVIVRVEWPSELSDWDMRIFHDSNRDGSSEGETERVGGSAQGPTNFEQSGVAEPDLVEGEQYVVRMVNFAAVEPYTGTITYGPPPPHQAGQVESWNLYCSIGGTERFVGEIVIARGEARSVSVNKRCAPKHGKG